MSVNSSSLLLPQSFLFNCFSTRISNVIFTAFTITNILVILPISILVLHLGCRRWRQQRSVSTSHSDFITYHMVAGEMIFILASIVYCIGVYMDLLRLMTGVSYLIFIATYVQISFHSLTCAEHYLAVLHPITYMQLRNGSGVRIRNIIICCVWLLGFAQMSFIALNTFYYIFLVYFMQQVLSLAFVSFCSFSVLRVLKRPGPEGGGGDRERVDQSKQRAFNTIMAIMGTLLLRFGGSLVCVALYTSPLTSNSDRCVVVDLGYWFGLPSSLVLPLLFLHRAGKLPCYRINTESGQGSS